MALYDVWITGTADWFSAKLLSDAKFVTSGDASVRAEVKEGQGLSRLHVTDRVVHVNRPGGSTGKVVVHTFVQTLGSSLEVELCHGDNGLVRIAGMFDSFTNDQIIDSCHNCKKHTLLLTSQAKAAFDRQYEANAAKDKVTEIDAPPNLQ